MQDIPLGAQMMNGREQEISLGSQLVNGELDYDISTSPLSTYRLLKMLTIAMKDVSKVDFFDKKGISLVRKLDAFVF